MSDDDADPLERLYVATDDAEGARALDGQELDVDALRDHLETLADAAEAVDDLVTEGNDLSRTGLREGDLVALMVGRKPSRRSIRDVKAFLNTLEEIQSTESRALLIRLLADLSDLTQADADVYLEELSELHERYPPEADR